MLVPHYVLIRHPQAIYPRAAFIYLITLERVVVVVDGSHVHSVYCTG